jgi:hypothetical protein
LAGDEDDALPVLPSVGGPSGRVGEPPISEGGPCGAVAASCVWFGSSAALFIDAVWGGAAELVGDAAAEPFEFEVTTRGRVTVAADDAVNEGSVCDDALAAPEPGPRDVCVLVFVLGLELFAVVGGSAAGRALPFTANEPS